MQLSSLGFLIGGKVGEFCAFFPEHLASASPKQVKRFLTSCFRLRVSLVLFVFLETRNGTAVEAAETKEVQGSENIS